jgi:hypothetical protein
MPSLARRSVAERAEMAKDKSKKADKASDAKVSASDDTPKKASVPRGVRKHLRELEVQLTDAARKEQKRLQKLERARQRRQSIDSALDKLRGPSAAPARSARPAPAAAAEKTPKPRTVAARPATTRRPSTAGTRTARKVAPPETEKSTD